MIQTIEFFSIHLLITRAQVSRCQEVAVKIDIIKVHAVATLKGEVEVHCSRERTDHNIECVHGYIRNSVWGKFWSPGMIWIVRNIPISPKLFNYY